MNGIQEVRGSTPLGSTSKINDLVEPPNLSSHLLVIDCAECAAAALSDRKCLIAIGCNGEPGQNETGLHGHPRARFTPRSHVPTQLPEMGRVRLIDAGCFHSLWLKLPTGVQFKGFERGRGFEHATRPAPSSLPQALQRFASRVTSPFRERWRGSLRFPYSKGLAR